MLNEQELRGLVVILNRVPMTSIEAAWLQALIQRLMGEIKQAQVEAQRLAIKARHAGTLDDPLPAPTNLESKFLNA